MGYCGTDSSEIIEAKNEEAAYRQAHEIAEQMIEIYVNEATEEDIEDYE